MIKDSKVRGVTVSTLCLSVQTTGTGCAGGQCWSPDVCVYISLLLVPWLTIVIPQLARYSSLPGVLIKYLSDFEVQIGFLSDLDYLFCLGVGLWSSDCQYEKQFFHDGPKHDVCGQFCLL